MLRLSSKNLSDLAHILTKEFFFLFPLKSFTIDHHSLNAGRLHEQSET